MKNLFQKILIKKKVMFILLGLITVLGIVSPLTFFDGNKILIGLDVDTTLRPSFRIENWFYTWASDTGFGRDVSSRTVNLPTQVFPLVVLEKAGLNLVDSQKIFFIMIFLLAGFSMFFLSLSIWEKEYILAFFAAILYMFNPLIGGYWVSFLVPAIWCLAVSPLLLGIFIRGVKTGDYKTYAIFLSLATLLYPAVSPPLYVMVFFLFVIFGGYFFISSKNKKNVLVFFTLSFVLTLLLNAWWLINVVRMFFISPEFLESGDSLQRLISNSLNASFLNLFRFQTNYWGFSYWGDKVNNWVGFLYETKPILVFLSFIYSFLAFVALLLSQKNKLIKILCLSSLLFIFLSKGLHYPFEYIFQVLMKLPLFNMFRTPAHKFPFLTFFLFSLIIGWLINQIYLRLSFRKKTLGIGFLFLSLLLFLSSQWYFFTGDAVQRGKSAQPSILVEFPKYYWEAAGWLKEDNSYFRVLLLPGSNIPTFWQIYKWGFLGAYCVPSDIFEKSTVDKLPVENSYLVRWGIYSILGDYSNLPEGFEQIRPTNEVYKILNWGNIKYILINHDVDWQHQHYGSEDPKILENELLKQKNIVFEKKFDNLHFYKVTSDQPKIFATTETQSVYGNKLGINQLLPFWNPEDVIYVDEKGFLNADSYTFANIINPIKKEELASNDFSRAVNFPYVRWYPRGYIYRFVRAKEDRLLKEIADPNTRGIFLLNLAAKRISEVEKWQSSFNSKNWDQESESYRRNMLEVLSLIENSKNNDNFLVNRFKIDLKAHESKLFLILKDNSKKNEIISNFLEEIEVASRKFFDTEQSSKINYSLKVPEEGKYSILLYNDNFNNSCEGKCLGRLGLNGDIKEINLKVQKQNWIDLGTSNFKSGDYNFVFEIPPRKNKANNISWQKEGNFTTINQEVDSPEDFSSFSQTIDDIYPNSLYRIKFDYRFDKNYIEIFVAEILSDGSERSLFNKQLITGQKGKLFNEIIRVGFNTKKIKIYISYPSAQEPKNVISDFQIERIFEPLIMLVNKNKNIENLKTPEIDYQKINPTKYQVRIKKAESPFVLAFMESYSPDWKAKINGIVLPEGKHKMINGYANSWFIVPNDSNQETEYEIELEYIPQRYFYLGIAISSFFCLACLLYLFQNFLKKKIK